MKAGRIRPVAGYPFFVTTDWQCRLYISRQMRNMYH